MGENMIRSVGLTVALILILSTFAFAQEAPQDLDFLLDEDTGTVELMWRPPLEAVEYYENFEDGIAQGYVYDNPVNWRVQNGKLVADFHPTGFYTYTSAMFQGEQFSEGYTEVEVSKNSGNLAYAKWLFIHTDTPYTNDGDSNGYVFSIAESGGNGMVFVGKFIDGATLALLPWTQVDYLNTGHGADNIMAFYADDDIYTAVVNGVPVFTFADTDNPSGHIGVGMAEQIGQFGWVEWEYVAHDLPGVALLLDQPRNEVIASSDSAIPILPDEWMRAPTFAGSAPKRTRVPFNALLSTGTRQLYQGESALEDFIEYRVYRDGDYRGVTTSNSYTDVLPTYGEYDYVVTAFWDEGESDYSNPITVAWLGDANWLLDETFDTGLPMSWTIEAESGTKSWMHSFYDTHQLDIFPTPYMLINSDAAGTNAHYYSRLITPEIDISEAIDLSLFYDGFLLESDNELLQVSWTGGSTVEWIEIASYITSFGPETIHHALPELPDLTDSVWFSWLYDDFEHWGWYSAVDNIKVLAEFLDPYTSFAITPHQTDIPPAGATLYYDVDFVGELPDGQPNLRYWTSVITPYGYEIGPLVEFVFGVQASFEFHIEDLSQNVPWYAPAGEYTFTAHVGSMSIPQYRMQDSFQFEKFGGSPEPFQFVPEDWVGGGTWPMDESLIVNTPSEPIPDRYALNAAYPNPFNAATTINIALPETSELTVSVYNIMGQQVAVLANGQYQAGQHNLTFNASNLASGLYFVQATVPGKLNQIQKVSLLK